MSRRPVPAMAILCLLGVALSGCGPAPTVTELPPLTAADKTYLHNLATVHGVTVNAQTEYGWVAIGHGICSGIAKDGVAAYMFHVSNKHYELTLAVAPRAIAEYCPATSAAYERWRKTQPQ